MLSLLILYAEDLLHGNINETETGGVMMKYKVFSATLIHDVDLLTSSWKNIPVVKCPKCGARMVPITVDTNLGIYPSEYSHFSDGKSVRRIVTGTMWECEFSCDEKVLHEGLQEG